MLSRKRLQWCLAVAVVGSSTLAFAAKKSEEPKHVETKPDEELRTLNENIMKGFAEGDTTTFKGVMGETMWSAWELDMMGRPIALTTTGETIKLQDDFMAAVKAMNAKLELTIRSNDCHSSGTMGVCLLEATQSITLPNMPAMSVAFRNTDVYQKDKKAGWRMMHHHSSIARAPELPAKFAAHTAKNASYQTMPGLPHGVAGVIPMHMNPITMASISLVKIGKEGRKETRHMHPAAYWAYIVEGGVTTTDASGKDAAYGAGTLVYRPAGEAHTTTMKPNTVLFMVTDGPIDAIPVDDKAPRESSAQTAG